MKSHFLTCELIIEKEPNKIEKKLIGQLGGKVEYQINNRKKVVIPFGSFVKKFLDDVRGIAASSAIASNGQGRKVSDIAHASAGGALYGILLGNYGTAALVTASYSRAASYRLTGASDSYSAMTMPTQIQYTTSTDGTITMYFDMSRTFTNGTSTTDQVLKEIYLAASNYASQGKTIFSVDKYALTEGARGTGDTLTITPGSVVGVTFRFQMQRSYVDGGVLMNFLRMIYNILMGGNLSAFSLQRYTTNTNETTYRNYSMYKSSDTGYYHGIVPGYFSTAGGELSDEGVSADPNISAGDFLAHTGLTLGANTVGSVSQQGDKQAYFEIYRTITNSSTVSKTIQAIVLLGHGGTGSTTGINTNSIPYAFNRLQSPIVLAPNQTIKITYRFTIEV